MPDVLQIQSPHDLPGHRGLGVHRGRRAVRRRDARRTLHRGDSALGGTMLNFLIGGFVAIGFYIYVFFFECPKGHLSSNAKVPIRPKATGPSRAFQVTLLVLLVIVIIGVVGCIAVAALLS